MVQGGNQISNELLTYTLQKYEIISIKDLAHQFLSGGKISVTYPISFYFYKNPI